MGVQAIPIFWPDEDQYPAFREIFGDHLPPTLDGYQLRVLDPPKAHDMLGLVKKVPVDLDDLRRRVVEAGTKTKRYDRHSIAMDVWNEARLADHARRKG